MVNFSTRSLAGMGLIFVAVALFGAGMVPPLEGFRLVLTLAAVVLTVGTYLIGTDVSGEAV